MDRRHFLKAGLAASLLPAAGAGCRAVAEQRQAAVLVGDMHFHLFFFGSSPAQGRSLAHELAAGKVVLGGWALVGDVPWLSRSSRGIEQKGAPGRGEALAWFQAELARIRRYAAGQGLKIARTAADIDLALGGDPHIVLAVEGAAFLDDDPSQLAAAHAAGIRQLQLVHYIRNGIGDFQTGRPEHRGLTELGKRMVAECNRLGILVDLAHCTPQAVSDALKISTAPMLWSHSSVARPPGTGGARGVQPVWQARQLPIEQARAIAAKGGVVGLWALRADVGQSPEAYADRLWQLADWLGEDHAGLGTDMGGIANPALASFADLQRVVDHWRRRGLSERRLRKLAIENYARVLKQALGAG